MTPTPAPPPRAGQVFAALGLAFLVYLLGVVAWMSARHDYAGMVAGVASGGVLPFLAADASVTAERNPRAAVFLYRLVDQRQKQVAQVRQRFLNSADVPLALSAGLALGFLAWRRRLLVVGMTTALLFVVHVALVSHTAAELLRVVGRVELGVEERHVLLPRVAGRLESWGDGSPVLVLGIALVIGLALRPRPSGG